MTAAKPSRHLKELDGIRAMHGPSLRRAVRKEGVDSPRFPADRLEASRVARAHLAHLSKTMTYPDLPVVSRRDDIVEALRSHQVLILAGETGSGKTTQLPKICLEAGFGIDRMIGVTQPRRVAAFGTSRRIAEELGCQWGDEVGCKVRFHDHTGQGTAIKVMTDGILLMEIQRDPDLCDYDVLMIDEAHERSLNIDFLLGYLRRLIGRRPELKVLITSATLALDRFAEAFENSAVLSVAGRAYPVETVYRPDTERELTCAELTVREVRGLAQEAGVGDVLVFLPTERDIREVVHDLEGSLGKEREVVPLYSRLSTARQQLVFQPGKKARVVVATNIAETSLTIPRVTHVVDTGLVRMSRYLPRTRIQALPIEWISKSSAQQRAGRAGRLRAGTCIRLYSRETFEALEEHTQPEILRANLAEVILRMKYIGLGEVHDFPFLERPPSPAINAGVKTLFELGALCTAHRLTPLGKRLAALPLDPVLGRMILQAVEEQCVPEVVCIVAGLGIQDPRERPEEKRQVADAAHKKFKHPRSDFLSVLQLWCAFTESSQNASTSAQRKFCKEHFLSYRRMREWGDTITFIHRALSRAHFFTKQKQQPVRIVRDDDTARYRAIHRALLAGLLGQVAGEQEPGVYKGAGNRVFVAFPGSALAKRSRSKKKRSRRQRGKGERSPRWVIAHELVESSRLFGRTMAWVEAAWILDLGGHLSKSTLSDARFDASSGKVLATESVRLFGMHLGSRTMFYEHAAPDAAREIFVREGLLEGMMRKRFDWHDRNMTYLREAKSRANKVRSLTDAELEEALTQHYCRALPVLSSVQQLTRLVQQKRRLWNEKLSITKETLPQFFEGSHDAARYPDQIVVEGYEDPFPLEYVFAPGTETDGVHIHVPVAACVELKARDIEALVPAYRVQQVRALLKSLPGAQRKRCVPVDETARSLCSRAAEEKDFFKSVRRLLLEDYGVRCSEEEFSAKRLPGYLRATVHVYDSDGEECFVGKDVQRWDLPVQEARHASTCRWERSVADLLLPFDESALAALPSSLEVAAGEGLPSRGWYGVRVLDDSLQLYPYPSKTEAEQSVAHARHAILRVLLAPEIREAKRALKSLRQPSLLHRTLMPLDELKTELLEWLLKTCSEGESFWPLQATHYAEVKLRCQKRLCGLPVTLCGIAQKALESRAELMAPGTSSGVPEVDINFLFPRGMFQLWSLDHLRRASVYARAARRRAERKGMNPARERQCWNELVHFAGIVDQLRQKQCLAEAEQLLFYLHEYYVSSFAQELGTAFPVSVKRIEKLCAGWDSL